MASIGIIIIAIIVIVVAANRRQWTASFKGYVGETEVSSILNRLPKEYNVINNAILPSINGTTQIDHIVVSPYGIFVIETKNYKGKIYGGDNSEMWTQYLWNEEHEFRNPIKQNYAHVKSLQSLLGFPLSTFIPIIAFANKTNIRVNSNFIVINFDKIRDVLLQPAPVLLSPEQVQHACITIQQAMTAQAHSAKEHVNNVVSQVWSRKQAISQGICPKCGSSLVRRTGVNGSFYGCSAYPKCKFTINHLN